MVLERLADAQDQQGGNKDDGDQQSQLDGFKGDDLWIGKRSKELKARLPFAMAMQSPGLERRASQDQRQEVNERNEHKSPPGPSDLFPCRSRIKNKKKNLYHSGRESSVFLVGDNKIRFVSRMTGVRLGG